MTEGDLAQIESRIHGEEEPDTVWFVETIEALVGELRRCGGPWEKIGSGAKAWDALQRSRK